LISMMSGETLLDITSPTVSRMSFILEQIPNHPDFAGLEDLMVDPHAEEMIRSIYRQINGRKRVMVVA
jgi:hypothetical protein